MMTITCLDKVIIDETRNNARIGRPYKDDGFISTMEKLFGRQPKPLPRGMSPTINKWALSLLKQIEKKAKNDQT